MDCNSLFHKHQKPHPTLLNKLRASENPSFHPKSGQTIATPGNSTTIKKSDNTYNLNNRNNSACSMNSTKQLINHEILKKKYSIPFSKETTLSNLLNKNPLHINQISCNKPFQGPLSQRLLKKTENLKVIDDLYKLPKPDFNRKINITIEKQEKNDGEELLNKYDSQEKSQSTEKKKDETKLNKENERKTSHDFSKETGVFELKSSQIQENHENLTKSVFKKHSELNNLIRILHQQNLEIANVKSDKSELQKKILAIKKKLQNPNNHNITTKKILLNPQKNIEKKTEKINQNNKPQQGFFSHRGLAKYSKEDEYLILHKSKDEENKLKEANELAELYLLTNENINHESQIKENIENSKSLGLNIKKNNKSNNNSRSLNESDLEKLLNNPNIQPSNKRYELQNFCQRNNSSICPLLTNSKQLTNNKHDEILMRKFSLDEKKNFVINKLEGKLKDKTTKIISNSGAMQDLNLLKERISNTLGKYQQKTEKLKEINTFLYNKIKREGIV